MATASIRLPDGTTVEVSGSSEEIARILELYGGSSSNPIGNSQATKKKTKGKSKAKPKTKDGAPSSNSDKLGPDLVKIIETIRNCDEAEAIETEVLDKSGQVNRILLPLYVMHEYFENEAGFTSGDVSRVTTDLGVPVSTANASKTLSGTASRYVIGDTVRRKGQPVRYKLGRRGVQYFKEVLNGSGDGK